jgi:ankyrin repeat protein
MKPVRTAKNLNAAIKAKNLDRVKEILGGGVKPDSASCFLAIEKRAYDILKAVIKGGADVNALEPYWNRTPVVKAVKLQDAQALNILLEARASPDMDCNGGPPLCATATTGWLEGTKLLIASGANLEQQNCSEITPLIIAARMGHMSVVKVLVEAGANPLAVDMLDRTAYEVAIQEKQPAIAQYLAPLCVGRKPRKKSDLELLLDAIKSQDRAAFERQLAACSDVNGQDKFGRVPLSCAIESGSVEIVERLLDSGADPVRVDALEHSVERGEKEIVRVLLRRGVEPNPFGSSDPLRTACALGNVDIVKMLLKASSNPNATTEPGADTALMMAARALSPEIVQALLDKGADVNACNRDGWTALFNAVVAPSVRFSKIERQAGSKLMWAETVPNPKENERAKEVVKLLLDNGADVNQRDEDGRTPLTFASSAEMTELLIKAGANVDVRDKRNHDALYWLKQNGVVVDDTTAKESPSVTSGSSKHSAGRRSSNRRRQ